MNPLQTEGFPHLQSDRAPTENW